MVKQASSAEWRGFGDKLIKERNARKPTTLASATFVKRMTSSAADPEAAEKEGEEGTAPLPKEK